jgi:hypothetical protein
MNYIIVLCALLAIQPTRLVAQQLRTRNVILVVTDGLRWQEMFNGADATLMGRAGNVGDTAKLARDYWRDTPEARRAALMPFVWGTMAKEGQIFGDSARGSVMRVSNTFRFSYPGYSEMFTGHADARINSNEHPPNENTTVFEYLNAQPLFKGKVAAIATWAAFTRIINAERSGVTVLDGWDRGASNTGTASSAVLRDLYATTVRYWPENVFDALMHQSMRDYLAVKKPRVMFIGYGETDEWAHAGRYDLYLQSAHQVDAYLAELWSVLQADPQYRNSTTLIVTTDHGRGYGSAWRNHGEDVVGAQYIWTAVIGPDTPPMGVRQSTTDLLQAQIAPTIAQLLSFDWQKREPRSAGVLPGVVRGKPVQR